jgi:hypothetical protein
MTTGGQIPTLRRWHVPVLRAVVAEPGVTSGTIAARFYRIVRRDRRLAAAERTLRELKRLRLVQQDGWRWSPALFAAEALAAERRLRLSPAPERIHLMPRDGNPFHVPPELRPREARP